MIVPFTNSQKNKSDMKINFQFCRMELVTLLKNAAIAGEVMEDLAPEDLEFAALVK